MKKTHRLLGLLAALLILQVNATQSFAGNIDRQTAQKLATHYMAAKTGQKSLTTSDLKLIYEIPNAELGIPALYFFNTTNGGYCIISGSDCMDPIVGYSTEGVLDPNNMPPAMLFFLGNFVNSISHYQTTNATPTPEVAQMWKELSAGNVQMDEPKQVYTTLLYAWDQSYPFNTWCPLVAGRDYYNRPDTTNAPTGCVATAMAQIMKWWAYPVQPKGLVNYVWENRWLKVRFDTVQFNYDLMPDSAFRGPSYNPYCWWNDDQKREVARFNYFVGLANQMSYGYDGSGAYSSINGIPALTNYFKYDKDTIRGLDRTKSPFVNNSSTPNKRDTLWLDTLAKEIKAKRPIFYSGHDNSSEGVHAGHAWVMSGYNSSNRRGYMNWGWGGSGNGWFNVISSQLTASGYTFSANHYCIAGIQPPRDTMIARGLIDTTTPVAIQVATPTTILPVYPNPARTWINIPYSLGNSDFATLEIYSIDGRLMERRTISSAASQAAVNVQNYPKGLYLCRIEGVTRKFVVE